MEYMGNMLNNNNNRHFGDFLQSCLLYKNLIKFVHFLPLVFYVLVTDMIVMDGNFSSVETQFEDKTIILSISDGDILGGTISKDV